MSMRRGGTGFAYLTPINRGNTHRGVRHWGCFCKPYPLSCRPCLWSYSYPFAYSVVVLPVSVARWSQFSGRRVPSAATFFGVSMHDLSGAVNVFLLLTVRPQLLLIRPDPDPDNLGEPESKLAPQNHQTTDDATLPEMTNYQNSPMPTTTAFDSASGLGNSVAV